MDRNIKNIAERLNVYNESVLKKTEEYLRLYQSKASVKTLNDQAKTVLCLDLASRSLEKPFDKEAALALTGLRKTTYQNNLNTVEKVLGLDKILTVSDICVRLGCTDIKDDAENILAKYKELDSKIKDFGHPQYVSVAVYLACKSKKVSIDKSKIVAISRLKLSQWKELLAEFENLELGKRSVKKKKNYNIENDEIECQDQKLEEPSLKKNCAEEIEEYEVWKKRILQEAYAALETEKKQSD